VILGYTVVFVQDVAASVDFYQRAFGLEIAWSIPEGRYAGQYVEFATGQTTLGIASNALGQSNIPGGFRRNSLADRPPGVQIGFVTDDVHTAFGRAVAAGATVVAHPETKPWRQVVSYVRDPSGVLIEISTRVHP
jgi:lactoylglutathione lyase